MILTTDYKTLRYLFVWPLVPTHCMCRGLLLHRTTLRNKHTFSRAPLDKRSALRRDLYLTTHNIYKRQTSILPAEFEPAVPTGAWPPGSAIIKLATKFSAAYQREIKLSHHKLRHCICVRILWNGRICSSPIANNGLPPTDTYIYIYLQMCVCVCVCVFRNLYDLRAYVGTDASTNF